MSGEAKRWVRNRTDQGVFVGGHGVIRADEVVEVSATDAVAAAIEQKVLAEASKPKPAAKTDQEGADS